MLTGFHFVLETGKHYFGKQMDHPKFIVPNQEIESFSHKGLVITVKLHF